MGKGYHLIYMFKGLLSCCVVVRLCWDKRGSKERSQEAMVAIHASRVAAQSRMVALGTGTLSYLSGQVFPLLRLPLWNPNFLKPLPT